MKLNVKFIMKGMLDIMSRIGGYVIEELEKNEIVEINDIIERK